MEQIHLSVIIPCYKEEKRLPNTLKEVDEYLSTQDYIYEIIVVDDGSPDQTAEKAEELDIKNLRVIKNKDNHGKGYVVKQGMLEAKGEYRLFMDADNATSVDQVEKMWPEFKNGYDIVIGSRDIKEADIAVSQSWIRQRLGDIFNLIVQFVGGLWGIWDTQCGFKGLTKKAVQEIFVQADINRFGFDVEILVIAKKLGYKIKEIPVRWINDPESTVKFKSMVKMLFEVLKIRWNLICRRYG